MKKFEFEQGDLYLGDHEFPEDSYDFESSNERITGEKDALNLFNERLENIIEARPEFKEYIGLWGEARNLDKYGVLVAHGDSNEGWIYFDKGKEMLVQSWIDSVDGKYSGLLLNACNPGSHTPASKKSVLVVPDGDVDFSPTAGKETIFDLIVLGIGEIDSNSMDYELRDLKKELKRK